MKRRRQKSEMFSAPPQNQNLLLFCSTSSLSPVRTGFWTKLQSETDQNHQQMTSNRHEKNLISGLQGFNYKNQLESEKLGLFSIQIIPPIKP